MLARMCFLGELERLHFGSNLRILEGSPRSAWGGEVLGDKKQEELFLRPQSVTHVYHATTQAHLD